MSICTRAKKEEAGWALLLFKDFISKHGDDILLHFLNNKVNVAPHFDFTNKYPDLLREFKNNQIKSTGSDYLWRVETDLGEGGAHHFIIYIGNSDKKITVLDPAIGTGDKVKSIYDIPTELAQLEKLAKENGFTYVKAGPPSACQPHAGISYEDTFCQTWSILLGLAYIDNPDIYDKYKFTSTDLGQLKLRLSNLFEGIQTIGSIITKLSPLEPSNPYKIFDSLNATCMITYNQPMPVRKHYTDALVFESLGFLISNQECQYLAVRDTPFKSKKGGSQNIKKASKKVTKKTSKKSSKKISKKGSKKTSKKGSKKTSKKVNKKKTKQIMF